MIVHHLRHAPLRAAVPTLFIGLILLLAPSPADALNNREQILIGGNSTTQSSTRYTAPGLGNQYTADFPSAGLGEQAAQVRMSGGGVLRLLRVRLVTASVPTSGSFTVTVRINGAPTALTCTLFGSGQCGTAGATTVNVPNGARLAVEVTNNFPDSGTMTYTYTMLLD